MIQDTTVPGLVGLWAVTRNDEGEIIYRLYIYGKVDDNHFIVQALSAFDGSPNILAVVHLRDMLNWTFYEDPELMVGRFEKLTLKIPRIKPN